MKLSVIIVAYKNSDVLLRCLDSIKKYNDMGSDLEVIVVDNSPKEERVEKAIMKSHYKNYFYIPARNNGYGAGNNIGARKAKGEIFAFLNPDIILVEPVFKDIYETFMTNNRLALMGVKLVYEDMSPGFSFYFDYKTSIVKKWTLKLRNRINLYDSSNMYIAGADLFVRREIFESVGMFDENIFMYYEEPDLIRRIRRVFPACSIAYKADIKMIHLEKKSTPSSVQIVRHELESTVYYGKKYNLDYKKKISFEYKYYKLKELIYKILGRDKHKEIGKTVLFIKENFSEYL